MEFLPAVIRAEYLGDYRIHLVFNDGLESTVDFSQWLDGPIFEPLRDPAYFRRFFLDGGTVAWPNGADVAPETLYERPQPLLRHLPLLGPELTITADVATFLGPTIEEEFRRSFPGLQIQHAVFKAAEGPSSFQLIADFITWSTVFKAAAGVFLSQLAKSAAEDLWKHKAELATKLRERLVQPLRFLSSTIAGLNQELASRRKIVQIGLPIPDVCWGTVVPIDSADEVEVAWTLAHFILQAEAINRTVAKLIDEGHSGSPYFELHLTPVGEWIVTWRDDADQQHEHRVS